MRVGAEGIRPRMAGHLRQTMGNNFLGMVKTGEQEEFFSNHREPFLGNHGEPSFSRTRRTIRNNTELWGGHREDNDR